jgi:HPt (histidine-containing phosphotransfer) domain-containing protein
VREQTRQQIIKELRDAIDSFGADFMMEIIDVYLADAPKRLADLRAAHETRDWQVFTRAAHTLKSSSAYVGAKHFAELAQVVEAASRQAAVADLAPRVAQLEQEYLQVKGALEEVRNGP